jgi:hypothetical protein
VNYFTDADPLLAVGSVAKARAPEGYAWHCYVGEEAGGLAPDLSRAEADLRRAIARGTRLTGARRQCRAAPPSSSRASKYWQGWNQAGR